MDSDMKIDNIDLLIFNAQKLKIRPFSDDSGWRAVRDY